MTSQELEQKTLKDISEYIHKEVERRVSDWIKAAHGIDFQEALKQAVEDRNVLTTKVSQLRHEMRVLMGIGKKQDEEILRLLEELRKADYMRQG